MNRLRGQLAQLQQAAETLPRQDAYCCSVIEHIRLRTRGGRDMLVG